MKDKQKNHQQHPRTSQQHQLSTHFLVLPPSPLALWNFNVTLSVAKGKCRILHNDLNIPYIGQLEKSIHYDI